MKSARFVWGLVLITIGLIFMGVNMGWWSVNAWDWILQFWPVILILVGLRKLIDSDFVFNFIALLIFIGIFCLLSLGSTLIGPMSSFNLPPWLETKEYRTEWGYSTTSEPGSEQASFKSEVTMTGLETLQIILGSRSDIQLEAIDTDKVSVNLTGPKTVINDLSLSPSGTALVLKDEDRTTEQRLFFGFGRSQVTGTIKLPKSLALDLDLAGATELDITGHTGKLNLRSSGASSVELKNSLSQTPTVHLSGASKLVLDRCEGQTEIEVSGASRFEAKSCQTPQLTLKASGGSSITIESGSVTNLSANLSGASQANLPKPTGQINQDLSGAAKLNYR